MRGNALLSEEDDGGSDALFAEQADTDRALRQLFGTAIADRYVDFCRLCSGRLPLRVSRPLAGHALRELDSLIRSVLAAPMEALPQEDEHQAKKRAAALNALKDMEFDEATLQRTERALKPQLNHRTQIEKIVKQLGLAPDGDIAKLWFELTRVVEFAHQRSFHERLEADAAFRVEFALKVDTVIRAVVTQLQDRYTALTRRAKEIAKLRPAQGVKLFRREIPGALPLLRYFYDNLSEDWLPLLEKEGLLGEPLPDEQLADVSQLRAWPAGQFLVRMASSTNEETRAIVARALRAVASSTHSDVQRAGLDAVAVLPVPEAAAMVDVVEGWLTPEFAPMSASPHALLKRLSEGGEMAAALRVTAALFRVSRRDGEVTSFFDPTMYDHYLLAAVGSLEKAGPLQALPQFCDALMEASRLDRSLQGIREEDYSYYTVPSLEPSPTDGGDVLSALVRAIVRFADAAIKMDPAHVRRVIDILGNYSPKIFRRIALHALASATQAAPDLAEACLTDQALIDADWCRQEYGKLARSWFGRLPAARQTEILAFIDSVGSDRIEVWHAEFEAYYKRKAGPEDDRRHREATFRDIVWEWQEVLPPDRRAGLEKTVAEQGGRDSWMERHFPKEPLTLTRATMQQQPVDDTVAHLVAWKPSDAQARTVPGLAFELQESVAGSPQIFSAGAPKFAALRPVFIRHFLDGLRQPAANGLELDWASIFDLLDTVIARATLESGAASAPGDDGDWSWTVRSAIDVLASSFGRGAGGMPFAHGERARGLVLALYQPASRLSVREDESRYDRKHRYLAAYGSLRGGAVDLCMQFIFWQSKDKESVIGRSEREAIANSRDLRGIFEGELEDRSPAGWIPRAVLGRYLNWLCILGEAWLKEQLDALFPADKPELADAAWLGYIEHSWPTGPLLDRLRPYYVRHLEFLGKTDAPPGFAETGNRLTDYLMLHFLYEQLPDDLLDLFLRSSSAEMRRQAMGYMGRQMVAGANYRLRAMAYFEQRLDSAIKADDLEPYRRELGAISLLFRIDVDRVWLLDQLSKMLNAGFEPTDPFSVVDNLSKLLPEHVDAIVSVTNALVRQPKASGWLFAAQDHGLRQILTEGRKSAKPGTPGLVNNIVNYLSSRGNTSFLNLIE